MENEGMKILYIDDEKSALFNFEQLFQDDFEVYTAPSAAQGMEILATTEIQIVISDQRMPKKTGIELLAEVALLYPDTIRILLTAYSEAEVIIDAINQGQVYQYITKPFETKNLKNILDKAAQNWRLKSENQLLVTQLQKKNEKLIQANEELLTSSKETEESKNQIKYILQTAMDGYWMTDMDGKFIEVNDAYCKMSGYAETELLNMHISDVEVIENKDETEYHIKKIIEFGSDRFESKHKRKDGSVYDVEISTVYQTEYINAFVVFIRDITEEKKAEKALLKSEEDYRNLIEFSPVPMAIIHDWKTMYFNPAAIQLFGAITESEILGKHINEFIHPDYRELAVENSKLLAEKGFVPMQEQKYLKLNGSVLDVETQAKSIRYNDLPATLVVINDISERKKAEKELADSKERLQKALEVSNQSRTTLLSVLEDQLRAKETLRESEEKLSTLFNSMTEMVVMHELVFDENGDAIDYRILDCNKTFTSITGIQKESAVGRLATEVYGIETAPYLQEYANVALNGTNLEFNTYYPPLDKYFLISVVSSEKNKFSTISTDITSNEQIHEIIKEKNKELENYIYVASHDLRSPLVNIQGFSKRLQKQTAELTKLMAEMNANAELAAEYKRLTTDDIPKSLSFILNNVSKMDTLINGLLQVSRTGRVVMSPTILEMNKLFKSILTIFDYQLKEMEANVVLHELDDCYGDTNQLNQLFSNIIGNALKYSDKNRKLTLEISSHTKYNKVTYSIKDNGIGINNRHLQKIWDVFYRVDASAPEAGEGLGLSLAKRIVDKHKGKIWAESVEGEGSTFFVELHKNKFEE
jgi:PAS domain S-box-containing protein